MIRNIIFDIGNVLTDYRWEGFLADKGFDAEMIKKIAKASIMHPLWAEYDRGTWTDEQVLAAFVKDSLFTRSAAVSPSWLIRMSSGASAR